MTIRKELWFGFTLTQRELVDLHHALFNTGGF